MKTAEEFAIGFMTHNLDSSAEQAITDLAMLIRQAQQEALESAAKLFIINAHLAGQVDAGVDPSYSNALAYRISNEQEYIKAINKDEHKEGE